MKRLFTISLMALLFAFGQNYAQSEFTRSKQHKDINFSFLEIHPDGPPQQSQVAKFENASNILRPLDIKLDLNNLPEPSGSVSLNKSTFPLFQPFAISPWNYRGKESIEELPAHVLTWVLVEIHLNSSGEETKEGDIISRRAGFIMDNGDIRDVDGRSLISLLVPCQKDIYIVLKQEDKTEICSVFPVLPVGGKLSYNFEAGSAQSYIWNKSNEKTPGDDIWGMFSRNKKEMQQLKIVSAK